MQIIKEFQESQIDMRGPGNPRAKPVTTGTVCILRFDDGKPLSMQRVAALFNEAARDFPKLDPANAAIVENHLEVSANPPSGYTKLPPRTIGARG